MTAVLRDQAKSARVTGTAGALVLVVAIVMMIVTAPAHSQSQHRPGSPAGPAVLPAQTVSEVIQTPVAGPGIRP